MINVIIIVVVVVVVLLTGLIIAVALYKSQQHRRKADAQFHPNAVTAVGMESIMPEIRRNSNGQLFSPEAVRAQKFRERAKSVVTLGKPEFRASTKGRPKSDLYQAIESQQLQFQYHDHDSNQHYQDEIMEEKSSVNDSQSNLNLDRSKELMQHEYQQSQNIYQNDDVEIEREKMARHQSNYSVTMVEALERASSYRSLVKRQQSNSSLALFANNGNCVDNNDNLSTILMSADSMDRLNV